MNKEPKLRFQWFRKRTLFQKILILVIPVSLIYPFIYLLLNLLMVFLLVFGDYFFKEILIDNLLINDTKEISIHKEYYNDTLYRLEISDYPCNETFFNCSQTIFKTKNEMISIFVINQNTDSVGVVIYYQNPKPFDGENRVFEFFDYNEDTVGIYNYIWLYEYTKPDKFDEDTLFIKRSDMNIYKKCDTIYLKPYL